MIRPAPDDRAAHERKALVIHPRKTFVLVADASRARLYSRTNLAPKLELVEAFEHPESRAKVMDLMADKPGRTFASGPMSAARSAKEYSTDPKDVEADKFARELGDRLAKLFDAHAFEALVIAAPAKFVGRLRATLATHHDHVSRQVVAWHEKDYSLMTDLSELSERLAIRDD